MTTRITSLRHALVAVAAIISAAACAQRVDYSVVYVPQESGIQFTRITSDADGVCLPKVQRSGRHINWFANRLLDVTTNNLQVAYLSERNGTTNVFIKSINQQGSSRQRTNRQAVIDFSYSPDGRHLLFTERVGSRYQINQTDAENGYVCRQITSGAIDYSPIYSADKKQIFFARRENNGYSIWSYNMENNFLSNYTSGINPYPLPDGNSVLCSRTNDEGRSEIWRVNYTTGVEECIMSDPVRSFTTPQLSPDGQWILMVGSSMLDTGKGRHFLNTDIYVCRTDGSHLMQLTYHAADDLSPVWSRDGEYILFISQRGSEKGVANVWMMNFVTQ